VLVAAAFVPTPPLLVPEIAAGSAHLDQPLRAACHEAVGRLLEQHPDVVFVVGCAAKTGETTGSWDWRGFGVELPVVAPLQALALGLAIGAWLLDQQPAPPPRRYVGVSSQLSPSDCVEVGRRCVSGQARAALLVCGDGTARLSEKAPGHFDPAAKAWDDGVARLLASGDAEELAGLDPATADRLLASGRAPWQVLAGAAAESAWRAELFYRAAPYGVAYMAGTWTPEAETGVGR
jgi:hypothetical protein